MTPAARWADLATCHQDQQHGHASCGCSSCWVSSDPGPSDRDDATSKAWKSPSRNNTSVSQPPLSPRTGKTVWEELAWEVLAPLEALWLSASLQRSGPASATLWSAMMSLCQARAMRGTTLVPSQGDNNNTHSLNNIFFLNIKASTCCVASMCITYNKTFFNFMTTQEQALLLLYLTGKGTDQYRMSILLIFMTNK